MKDRNRKEKKVFIEGDPVAVHFKKVRDKVKDKNKLIGRADNGIICFLNMKRSAYVKNNETWLCEVEKVNDRNMLVFTKEILLSAEENEQRVIEKTKELIKKYKS